VNADIRNSYQGVSRVIQRLVLKVGATIIEDLEYADLCAMWYPTLSRGRKDILKKIEGYSRDNLFVGGARRFAVPLQSSLFVTDQAIPLPLIQANGGLTIDIHLAPIENLITTATTNVPYYTIDFPAFKAQMLTPNPAFTSGLVSAVRSGRSAFLAMQRIRSFRSVGNGSVNQLITVPVGAMSSITSVETIFYRNA